MESFPAVRYHIRSRFHIFFPGEPSLQTLQVNELQRARTLARTYQWVDIREHLGETNSAQVLVIVITLLVTLDRLRQFLLVSFRQVWVIILINVILIVLTHELHVIFVIDVSAAMSFPPVILRLTNIHLPGNHYAGSILEMDVSFWSLPPSHSRLAFLLFILFNQMKVSRYQCCRLRLMILSIVPWHHLLRASHLVAIVLQLYVVFEAVVISLVLIISRLNLSHYELDSAQFDCFSARQSKLIRLLIHCHVPHNHPQSICVTVFLIRFHDSPLSIHSFCWSHYHSFLAF